MHSLAEFAGVTGQSRGGALGIMCLKYILKFTHVITLTV